jgi:hypothetical protein
MIAVGEARIIKPWEVHGPGWMIVAVFRNSRAAQRRT